MMINILSISLGMNTPQVLQPMPGLGGNYSQVQEKICIGVKQQVPELLFLLATG